MCKKAEFSQAMGEIKNLRPDDQMTEAEPR